MASSSNLGAGDFLRDRELAQWLEQRLDSTDGIWTASRNLCSALTKNILANVPSCFVDLQTHIKLKILLSVLYFPKRNVDQWRDEIEDVLSLACQDTEDWVKICGELLKEYPTTSGISFNMENDGGQFTKTLQELRKLLRRQLKGPCAQVLPLDAAYMNKQAANATWGVPIQQPSAASVRYFSLKRKPKAAAQRIDFLQKSADVATQMKFKNGSLSSILPIRHKNSVRRMDDNDSAATLVKNVHGKISTPGFRPPSKPISRQASMTPTAAPPRRIGAGGGSGVKLIDINETPQALEKKRKTIEAEEKAAKKAAKEEVRRQKEEEKLQKKIQRDTKVQQRSLPQNESQLPLNASPSAESGASEKSCTNGAAFIHPTPDYAAELFESAISAVRAAAGATTITATIAGTGAAAATNASVPQSYTSTPVASTVVSPSVENRAAVASLAGVSQAVNSTGGNSVIMETSAVAGAAATVNSTPNFFGSPVTAGGQTDCDGGGGPVAMPPADDSSSSRQLSPSAVVRDKSPARGARKAQTQAKATGAGAKAGGGVTKGKKRKSGQAAVDESAAAVAAVVDHDSSATDRRTVGADHSTAPSLNSPPQPETAAVIHQIPQQYSHLVRFQSAASAATLAAPSAVPSTAPFVTTGRGIGVLAQNVFAAPQQFVLASHQQQPFPPQTSAARTIVFVQQPIAPSQLGVYNTAAASATTSQLAATQQPQPPAAAHPMLTSFTPSVIRQTPPSIPAAQGVIGSAAPSSITPTSTTAASISIQQQQQLPGVSDADSKKPTFTITKDVMLKAQEMFRTANKLSRPEKALILGFMAGNRDNPCPQMGRVLTVRLSENQDVQTQQDGTQRPVMVETYFQMNYDTGEWKQIRKIRPLREGEASASS